VKIRNIKEIKIIIKLFKYKYYIKIKNIKNIKLIIKLFVVIYIYIYIITEEKLIIIIVKCTI